MASPTVQAAKKNVAAWALEPQKRPLTVSKAPYTAPPKDCVVVKVNDVAVNPIDWILQESDAFNLTYPAIFGQDVAGEIVEVGDGVDDFKIGQRVIAHCDGSSSNQASHGGFQKYTVVRKTAVAELPSSIPSSVGVVLPLGISTASAGLYQKGYLKLPFPTEDPSPLERSIVVWGGSSSVGACAIQLAVASGLDVVATASERNFDFCKQLGARAVFDYHADDVEDQVVAALKHCSVAGAYHAAGADGAVQACARIVDRAKGKAIVVTVRGVPDDGVPDSVRVKSISSPSIFENDVGPYIWRSFLPKALASGTIVPQPQPKIVGEELRSVQLGLDTQKKGVSAQKIVVSYIAGDTS